MIPPLAQLAAKKRKKRRTKKISQNWDFLFSDLHLE